MHDLLNLVFEFSPRVQKGDTAAAVAGARCLQTQKGYDPARQSSAPMNDVEEATQAQLHISGGCEDVFSPASKFILNTVEA